MSNTLRFLKNFIRPVATEMNKRQLKGKLLADLSDANSGYDFTEEDVDLYVAERFVRLPTHVTEKSNDPELVTVTINGRKIFWPETLPDCDLPWLFHEVFDEFTTNPSSYNLPELDYELQY